MICGARWPALSHSQLSMFLTSIMSGVSRGRFSATKVFNAVLYAGHVLEGDGTGFDGVPANDRRYTHEQCVRAFHSAAVLAQHTES